MTPRKNAIAMTLFAAIAECGWLSMASDTTP
jgi:hypothetical protein